MFFRKNKDVNQKENEPISNDNPNNFNENYLIFTNYVTGIKGMPLYTPILLVNNIPDNSLDIIYNLSNNKDDNKTIKYPMSVIKKYPMKQE